jgi:5-methylcytosine-specific restriction endonuclease McrA
MSRENPVKRNSTRGRSVAQYAVTASGERGHKIAEFPTITAASNASKLSYHVIRGILDGKRPKPDQYYWIEIDNSEPVLSIVPPQLPSRSPNHLGGFPYNGGRSLSEASGISGVPTPRSPFLNDGASIGIGSSQSGSSQLNRASPAHTGSRSQSVNVPSSIHTIKPPRVSGTGAPDSYSNRGNQRVPEMPHSRSLSSGLESKSKKKQAIPSLMRTQIWNRWIGIDKGQVKCPYCQINNITPFFFECGHVLAEAKGGEVSIENLRPICGECNRKMSTQPIDLNKYRLASGIAGRLNSKTQEPYPSTIDGRRAFIEAHTLTNTRGDIGESLQPLKYKEAEKLATERWNNWVEVYEMCTPHPVLVTEKAMRLHPYSDQLYTRMICDTSRSALSRALQKLAL